MDGSNRQQGPQVDIEVRVREIKTHMPATYKAIQAKAAEAGRGVYAMVRRAIAGQPNQFYAVERGWVAGTPFNQPDITADVAVRLVAFGASSFIMWGLPPQQEPADGPQ